MGGTGSELCPVVSIDSASGFRGTSLGWLLRRWALVLVPLGRLDYISGVLVGNLIN
jgi:hypothetical protein